MKEERDGTFIIVSDHGFDQEKKTQSQYGFYSSNIPLVPEPKKITDFFPLIVNRKWR